MNSNKDYFKGKADNNDFDEFKRDDFKSRTGFEETTLFKMSQVSIKLFSQAVQQGKDVNGNDLTPTEIKLADQFLSMAKKEVEHNRAKFDEQD